MVVGWCINGSRVDVDMGVGGCRDGGSGYQDGGRLFRDCGRFV